MNEGVAFRKVLKDARLPQAAHTGDAAYDVYAAESCIVTAGKTASVRTGLVMETCPADFHPQLCSRSGMAANYGIDVVAGIIDPGYRGEICVVLNNRSDADFVVAAGDRVAQMRFVRIAHPHMTLTEDAGPETARGEGGFGSTGI